MFQHSSALCLFCAVIGEPRVIVPAPRVSVYVVIGPHVSPFQSHVSLFMLSSGPTLYHSSATYLCSCCHRALHFIIPAPRVSVHVVIGPHVLSFQRHVSLYMLSSGPTFAIPAPHVSVHVVIGPHVSLFQRHVSLFFFCHRAPRFIIPAPHVSVYNVIGPHVLSFQRHMSLFMLSSGSIFYHSRATCLRFCCHRGPTVHNSSATCLCFCCHQGPTFHRSSATCLCFYYHQASRFIIPATCLCRYVSSSTSCFKTSTNLSKQVM